MISRLLIANRGEIAVRIIAACRELGTRSIAIHSEADAHAVHVSAADEAVCVGPAAAADSYLSIPKIIQAARTTAADAIHPGYGFLSENAAFAAACEAAGIVFVGPPSSVIASMGSKIEARRLMQAAGVPIVPGETPDDQSDEGLRRAVAHVGLPVLIKASAGGGGKGMRRVSDESGIAAAVQSARREAAAAFGDGTLYVERLIERPRHVEVQVMADAHGHVVHLFERECSAQRRHQKVVEETPSPAVDAPLRRRMTEAAVRAARSVSYRNAGTIEFLVDLSAAKGGDAPFYFLEMNTRLQVEHPVTELTTGVDLVRAQLQMASGAPLPWRQEQLVPRGHAIEARVYAEDPARGFLPQAGRIARYVEPRAPGVRIDSGIAAGSEVPVHYDPLLAKVIAWAETRDLAIARLSAALRAFTIEGIATNIPFLVNVLGHPSFKAGDIDTGFLDREAETLVAALPAAPGPPAPAPPALPGPPGPPALIGWWDPWSGKPAAPPRVHPAAAPEASRTAGTRKARSGPADAAQTIAAPMPATVIQVLVKPGDAVKKGDTVVVLEAMKMELPLRAAGDATVTAVHCRTGELVQPDAVLVELN
jgi:acetyl-CoA carboxylase biotin carboxylase subunit